MEKLLIFSLLLFTINTTAQINYTTIPYPVNQKPNSQIVLGNGHIALTYDDGNLYIYDGDSWLNYLYDDPVNTELYILALGENDIIWLLNGENGIVKFDNGEFTDYNTTNSDINSDQLNSIYFKNNLLYTIASKSIGIFNGSTWETIEYVDPDGVSSSLFSLVEIDGVLWISNFSGLVKYENGIFTKYNSEELLGNTEDNIFVIYESNGCALIADLKHTSTFNGPEDITKIFNFEDNYNGIAAVYDKNRAWYHSEDYNLIEYSFGTTKNYDDSYEFAKFRHDLIDFDDQGLTYVFVGNSDPFNPLYNIYILETNYSDTHQVGYLSVDIYPNPVKDQLNIELSNQKELRLELYNSVGKIVLNHTFYNSQHSIDTSDLPDGIYFLSLFDNEGNKSVERLIIR